MKYILFILLGIGLSGTGARAEGAVATPVNLAPAPNPPAAESSFDLAEAKGSNRPVLLFVHGGAWITGDKADYAYLAPRFTAAGLCVATMNYGLAPEHVHPEPIKDLESVLAALAQKKSEHCDFNHLYLMGHSAGAHLIAFWATAYDNPAVKGLIGLEGIYDLPRLAKDFPKYDQWFLHKEFGQAPAWAPASPTLLKLREKAPWLLVQSEKDELVNKVQTTDFAKHLEKLNIPVEVLVLPTGSHDQVIRETGTPSTGATARILEFLNGEKPSTAHNTN